MLVVTGRDGHVLDSVTLDGGRLAYSTGAARAMVEAPRALRPGLTDGRLYELAAGSSNGYVTVTESGAPQE